MTLKNQKMRALRLESLESRRVLAGAVALPPLPSNVSPWHNEIAPSDVNRDGSITVRDAAAVISGLTLHGPSQLEDWAGGEGEADSQRSGPFSDLDVDGDWALTPRDAQQILAELFASGAVTGIVYDGPEPASEPRFVDGDVLYDFDWSGVFPADSQTEPDGDVHVNEAGPEATPLATDDWAYYGASLASIDPSDDVDVFQFTAMASVEYSVSALWLSEAGEVRVEVVDESGEVLAEGATSEAQSWASFSTPELVESQTYFLRVSGDGENIGDYYVSTVRQWGGDLPIFQPQTDAELGNDIHADQAGDDATLLPLDQFGYLSSVDSNIDSAADIDAFRVELPSEGSLYVGDFSGADEAIGVEVLDADGNVLTPSDSDVRIWDGSLLRFDVDGGEYFVLVSGVSDYVGPYAVEVFFSPAFNGDPGFEPPTIDPDSPLGEDIHADQIGDDATRLATFEASGLSIGGVTSNIDTANDVDVFRLDLNSQAVYFVSMTARFDFEVVLTDASGEVLAEIEPVESSEEFGLAGQADLPRGETVVYASIRSTDGSTGQYEFGFVGFEGGEF